jgi:DNA processing protein
MARRLAEELAEIGVVTISGLARGIDTCVHSASLKAGGQTWAVIGSGLEEVYPLENRKLANDIL